MASNRFAPANRLVVEAEANQLVAEAFHKKFLQLACFDAVFYTEYSLIYKGCCGLA